MAETACPHCKKPIYDDDALFCHFCGESLSRSTSSGIMGPMRYGGNTVLWFVIVAMIILGFLMMTLW